MFAFEKYLLTLITFYDKVVKRLLFGWLLQVNYNGVRINETRWFLLIKPLRILTGKKEPSNKTQALTKRVNMDIWVVGTTNQLFIRGS